MSLLLKALKQAETAHSEKSGAARTGVQPGGDFELEPATEPSTAAAREWVEPPGLLFGSSGLSPAAPRRGPAFRLPQLSLVPMTALLAALIALGYGIYLYFALQPPVAVALTPATVSPTPIHPTLAQPDAPPVHAPLAALPPPDANPVAAPSPAKPPAAAPATPPSAIPPVPLAANPVRTPHPVAVTRSAVLPQFQPDTQSTLLAQAYTAYQRGALDDAQRLYGQAAARGQNVDALLGLAAVASARNHEAEALQHYREVLDIDPRNAAAQGALLDLLGNTDSQATESRLKTLIERDPSPQLHQALGNLYASQARWGDAQAAYFEAWRGAPDHADYAFNLAVSLDQLQQFATALTYYEKALAAGGVHRFDRALAETRVRQLKSAR